jgi:O-antigen ligase
VQDPALSQQLKVLALCGAGLLLAMFLGSQIGHENYGPLLLGAVIIFVAAIALFSGRSFWVLTIASSFLGGTFPILGAKFTPFQILMAIGVAKFLVGDVVLRRTRLNFGNRFDTLMIAGFIGVLTLHGVRDRFGMRFLGSMIWGGHNYVNVYVALVAFFVVQSIPTKSKLWAKLPYLVLAVATFDLLIAVITTIFPKSIYVIYPFYSAVSSSSFEEVLTGTTTDITGRIGAFGNFGFGLILIVLASIRLTQILNPRNFFRVLCLIAGFAATLVSGFRSAIINAIIGFFAAGIRDLRFGVIALLPLLALILFALSFVNSQVVQLPKQVQRGLAFFPAHWDADMVSDARASNDFRKRIWSTWAHDYFPVHPLLGRGFGFKSQWAQASVYRYNPNWDLQTVETGNIHNGLFATVDTFGIIGTIFFVVWNLRLLARTLRLPFGKTHPEHMALRFLALYLAVWIISYWFGALNVGTFLPLEFGLAGVFLRLQEAITSEESSRDETAPNMERGVREELATA